MFDSQYLQSKIRAIPNWPQPGVIFRDITPLLQDPLSFRVLVNIFVHYYMQKKIDVVAGIDARGFILGSVVAYELNVGFVPIRKQGKLPYQTISEPYSLEYGTSAVELHTDAVHRDQHVLLIDDLIATGGTMLASISLLKRLGAQVSAAAIVNLKGLKGSELITAEGVPLFTPCEYE